jgi:uncharacterized protein YecT (DUF1311 family)
VDWKSLGFTALLLLVADAAAAESALARCYEGAESRLQVRPCLEARLAEAESALRRADAKTLSEMQALAAVTGRDDALEAYRAASREFARFRTANCHWYGVRAEPGTGAGDIELDCRIRTTESRAAELGEGRAERRE